MRCKMKKLTSILLALFFVFSFANAADASWLSKMLDKLDALGPNVESSASAVNSAPEDPNSSRWAKISENPYFSTFADKRTLKASGTAQNRKVEGYFKLEFTPVGSAWIGNNSRGRVKPDVITHVIFYQIYGVNEHSGGFAVRIPRQYYDVHGNLIYKDAYNSGDLSDASYGNTDTYGEKYTPDSEQERIKDILFKAFGWDY